MSKIDKYFGGTNYITKYNYQDKQRNVQNYVKYMLNRSLAMFKYHNLPETIPQREIELLLQTTGYGIFCEVEGKHYVLYGSLGGEGDAYNNPTVATISNPYLKFNKNLKIDEECVVIPNDSMMIGLLPLYEKYCTILNESDISMILATVNKRVQMLLSANDDNTAQSAKKFLQDIENGKLGVIAETKLFDSLKVNNSANGTQSGLVELYQLHQYTKASLFNEIGLGANWNSKKERLNNSEVEFNTDNLYPLVDDMLESRRNALDKINEMFGLDIQIEFNSSWDHRVLQGEPINTMEGEPTDEPTDDSTIEPTEETNIEPTIEPSVEPTVEPTVEGNDDHGEVDVSKSEDGGTSEQSDEVAEDEEQSDEEEPTDEEDEEEK